jgi:Protein of unknown function (DUF4232)
MLLGPPAGAFLGLSGKLRGMRLALLLGIFAALAAPAGSQAGACSGIGGRFSVVRGSAGAGNVVYALRLHNSGPHACLLPGLPRLRLLGAGGRKLPTNVAADPRYKARPFVLRPGKVATAKARFSPDVPGKGESTSKACEPVARTARVFVPGTSVIVPLRPPTRVCEHGRLSFTPYR